MEQSNIISCFDDEIIKWEKERNTLLKKTSSYLLSTRNDVKNVLIDFNKFKNIDLYNLQAMLALDFQTMDILNAYEFFMNSKCYPLTNNQKEKILLLFRKYLEILDNDIQVVINNHPEIMNIDKMIYALRKCRGMLLNDDFGLKDFVEITRLLNPYKEILVELIQKTAIYMNSIMVKNNRRRKI